MKHTGDKIMAYISIYEAYIEEMKQLSYEAKEVADRINEGIQILSDLSTVETANILNAIEDMKISHAEFITVLTDNNLL